MHICSGASYIRVSKHHCTASTRIAAVLNMAPKIFMANQPFDDKDQTPNYCTVLYIINNTLSSNVITLFCFDRRSSSGSASSRRFTTHWIFFAHWNGRATCQVIWRTFALRTAKANYQLKELVVTYSNMQLTYTVTVISDCHINCTWYVGISQSTLNRTSSCTRHFAYRHPAHTWPSPRFSLSSHLCQREPGSILGISRRNEGPFYSLGDWVLPISRWQLYS